ncbi:pRiA4b ORF-3-like protein [Kribbella antiqua]|uniref:PRiA4b ORF-3-like protein n=1 Tax=Kribbella antiqua TaxID=2512217 RepID=A0A4R2I2G3_9ACTN|nr:plasmid pRiA4b ORF-3 family protein [Kribbella antiqua]TCO38142.1 pRiA4b ORF-3-like protein [Kribbella antiqua]
MADNHERQAPSLDKAELLEQFKALISGMGSDELHGLLPQMMAAGMDRDPFEQAPPPSRRRARRDDVVTYRVRVDLTGTKPPLWRRLELASDLFLNEVHEVIQAAFGWTDSHLHEFASGKDYYHALTEHYLCPFEVEEGRTGVPEEDVRLDEVLAEQGDALLYLYDFGDDWMHVIKLENARPRDESAPRAVCIGGRRPGPSEDCGGVHGYERITAALDPAHPEHAAAVADYAQRYGDDANPGGYAPSPFDPEEINEALTWLTVAGTDLPGPLDQLVGAIRSATHRHLFQQLIADADLDAPIEIDANAAARMVSPYSWLLDRVGTSGIKLTSAGYLPPSEVEAAMAELGLHEEWIGKGNREVQTLPVLHLRESAQAMGLLRKYRGALLLTPRGRALRSDPLALWWHLAEQMPPASREANETQAGVVFLTTVAAGSVDDANATIAELLTAIGWASSDGTPVTPWMAGEAAWDTKAVLRRLGALVGEPGRSWSDTTTPEGVTFARAALRSWPS